MLFFDTYAIWEIRESNPAYAAFSNENFVCTIFNLAEYYTALRRKTDAYTASKIARMLDECLVNVSVKNIIDAVEMRKKFNKSDMSLTDCVGYIKGKELGIKFLTGDKAFEKMDNVEFVR